MPGDVAVSIDGRVVPAYSAPEMNVRTMLPCVDGPMTVVAVTVMAAPFVRLPMALVLAEGPRLCWVAGGNVKAVR